MERYLYIFIILVIFLCICLVCNGCMNLYDRFSVGNDVSGINISTGLTLSTTGFTCVKPSPAPAPPATEGEPPNKNNLPNNGKPESTLNCCDHDNHFSGDINLLDDLTCGEALLKEYINPTDNTQDINTMPEGYIVKWPGYKDYYRRAKRKNDKCFTLNDNRDPDKFKDQWEFTKDNPLNSDINTISIKNGSKTNYLYAGPNTNHIMNPTFPGGLCYKVKENGSFNNNTCMGGDPFFPKISKCIDFEELTEEQKNKSILSLKNWEKEDIDNIKKIWETDPENYKLGVCEPFDRDHQYTTCVNYSSYLSDCSKIIDNPPDFECLKDHTCLTEPTRSFQFDVLNKDGKTDNINTIIQTEHALTLTPSENREDLKITFNREDQISGTSIHDTIYATIWLSTACQDNIGPSNDIDCDGCYNGCNKTFGGGATSTDKEGNWPGMSGWNEFPKEITNIPLKNNTNTTVYLPNKYIGFESSVNYNLHNNNAIMASGGRILFHTLPISEDENIIKYVNSLDSYDQIEFSIQYRTNNIDGKTGVEEGSRVIQLNRMVTNFSAVDSLRSNYIKVENKVLGKTLVEIECKPKMDHDLNDICKKFYSKHITDLNFNNVIGEIIDLTSKWYDFKTKPSDVNINSIDTTNQLTDINPTNCNTPNGCKYASYKRISDKCMGIKNMSDFGTLTEISNKLSESSKQIIDPNYIIGNSINIDNLLIQLGHFNEIQRYYDYCKAHDNDDDKTLYYYFGPASMLLLTGIYQGDSNDTTYNGFVVEKLKLNNPDITTKINNFKDSLPELNNLNYFNDTTVINIQVIANKFYDIFDNDENQKYLFPTTEMLNDVTDDYIKKKVLIVVMNYSLLTIRKNNLDINKNYGIDNLINSMEHTVSPYINGILQRGYGDLITIKTIDYNNIIIKARGDLIPKKPDTSKNYALKWTQSFKNENIDINASGNYCKGVAENIIDRNTVKKLHGDDDFFYNDWIDLVFGKDALKDKDGSNLGSLWGSNCLQYPISYGDSCDPESTSVITNYTDAVNITFGLYK